MNQIDNLSCSSEPSENHIQNECSLPTESTASHPDMDPLTEIVRTMVGSNGEINSKSKGWSQKSFPMYFGLCVAFLFVIDSIVSVIQYDEEQNNNDMFYHENVMIDYSIPMLPTMDEMNGAGICSVRGSGNSMKQMVTSSSHSHVQMDDMTHSQAPLWNDLIQFEIGLYQNLIHGSLLGATLLVVQYRGDIIWLFFVRNFFLFTSVISIIIFLSDVFKLITVGATYWPVLHNKGFIVTRLVVVLLFAVLSTVSYLLFERICRNVRHYVITNVFKTERRPNIASKDGVKTNNIEFGDCNYSTESEGSISDEESVHGAKVDACSESSAVTRNSNIIYYSAAVSQGICILFFVCTTIQWIKLNIDCHLDENDMEMNHNTTNKNHGSSGGSQRRLEGIDESMSTTFEPHNGLSGDLHAFSMSYTMIGHQAFLLALIQLGSFYPNDFNTICCTIVTAVWRFLIALCNLFYISQSMDIFGKRHLYSLLFTSLEFVSMIPILYASIALYINLSGVSQVGILYKKKYNQIDDCRNVEDLDKPDHCLDSANDGIMIVQERAFSNDEEIEQNTESSNTVERFTFTTLQSIARSDRYSQSQRIGAALLFISSSVLLVEMTLEGYIALRQTFIGTQVAFDLYKWGLHIVVVYAAVVLMSVETQFIYKRMKPLLLVACPIGSVIALWQIITLIHATQIEMLEMNGKMAYDLWTIVVSILFSVRFICGILQTIGLLLLSTVSPISQEPTHSPNDICTAEEKQNLETAMTTARNVLFKLYFPCTALYIVFATVAGSCSEPMISPMIPSDSSEHDDVCIAGNMDLMLSQNWPGMGLFFHFGLFLPLFTLIGLNRGAPMYKPALLIASYQAGNLGSMIFCNVFIWDMIQSQGWTVLSVHGIAERLLLIFWMLSTFYLSFSLHRLWKRRVISE